MDVKRKGKSKDELVKVSSNDTLADFLKNKLVAGANITITELNDGGNETLEIKVTTLAADDLHFHSCRPTKRIGDCLIILEYSHDG